MIDLARGTRGGCHDLIHNNIGAASHITMAAAGGVDSTRDSGLRPSWEAFPHERRWRESKERANSHAERLVPPKRDARRRRARRLSIRTCSASPSVRC
jgi:hypothetical protein